ncbi:uncharacterized protein LOC129738523 [Uranotaenia lowii]|uniref:uncharacterized protein LOC129738523 n=1 Tax=Uranotaenia lowii TaxID=190385 RepID=UPI00247902FC|nr:uncharacterized protein LOC129738523 [Uranotaenia lowii]XP_055585719.1 uncharacterized protein LOC129738523 [Uranotaenia lowii]XP_055585720.1 uncharacterized protein LOC129738523 [Uranotaenia lowii]
MQMQMLLLLSYIKAYIIIATALNTDKQDSPLIFTFEKPTRSGHARTVERLIAGHMFSNYKDVKSTGFDLKNSKRSRITSRDKPLNNNSIDNDVVLLTASAGGGDKKQVSSNSSKKDESKKTLSDQVAEGKYGLIHTELFQTKPVRPGVLSYKSNSEVPNDNSKNYGGLNDKDIWISEAHLLVLKGGSVNENDNKPAWKAIDDYEAPTRQVKIPPNPKVPPPFPVQLTDNGPLQFIGNNQLSVYNPFTNQSVFLFSSDRIPDIQSVDLNPKNNSGNGYQYPPPVSLPINAPNQTFSNPFLNLPPLPPLEPGSGSFDEQNNTDIDNDDPSLFYPPPYSFEYKSNYTNVVAPGPLVPGIVLPPPPNFFSLLEPETKPIKTPLDVLYRINDMKLRERLKINTTTIRTNNNIMMKNTTQVSTIKPSVKQPLKIETPNYYIEIEKAQVQGLSPPKPNDTTILKTVNAPVKKQPTVVSAIQPTKKPLKNKTNAPPRTQLHKIIDTTVPPLITFNQQNLNHGNPIYFEYFDARTPVVNSYDNIVLTTSAPTLTTTSVNLLNNHYRTSTFKPPFLENSGNKKPSKTYLPSKNKDFLYTPQDIENLRLQTMREFSREIETIRQTLRLYKNSVPLISNYRTPKRRPIHIEFDRQPLVPRVPTYTTTVAAHVPPHVPYNAPQILPEVAMRTTTASISDFQRGVNSYAVSNSQFSNSNPQIYDKHAAYSVNNYRDDTVNVGITSLKPQLDYPSFTTVRPIYYNHPSSWYAIENFGAHQIPKPLIYNNGASGYNQRVYLPDKLNYQPNVPANSMKTKQQTSQQYEMKNQMQHPNGAKQQLQQNVNEPYLEKDILINYKNPLPVIDPDSEYLPYNGKKSHQVIQYQLPRNKARVYFIAPQNTKGI